MKKDRAIVFTVTKNLTFAVSSVMMDIKRISPDLAEEVVVLHNGISKKDQKHLESILPTRFIEYKLPYEDTSFIPRSILDYFTYMVFSKFECLKLLDEYKSVMLLDYDILVKNDISELFDICESGIKMMPGNLKVSKQLHSDVQEYNMEEEGICACIFVVQDHLKDYMKMYNFCYDSLEKYAKSLYMPEQAIFDFMIQEFNLKICSIDSKVYSPHPTDEKLAPQAKIIHAYGQPKFWNGLEDEQWNRNYSEWLKMGGSKYKKKNNFLLRIKNKIVKIIKGI